MGSGAGRSVSQPRLNPWLHAVLVAVFLIGLSLLMPTSGHAETKTCGSNNKDAPMGLPAQPIMPGGAQQPDLQIIGYCLVASGSDYYYGRVNVTSGGVLTFKEGDQNAPDKVTNFWARSIIVENGGAVKAGADTEKPYGTNGFTLNIILYGKDLSDNDPISKPAGGDLCVQANCGVPKGMWDDNKATQSSQQFPGCGDKGNDGKNCLPGQPAVFKDYFYQYAPIYGTKDGYYGYKVLAVGYGGTLQLNGWKGTLGGRRDDAKPIDKNWTLAQAQTSTGSSWVRLVEDLPPNQKYLKADAAVIGDWRAGDKIVATTTDYIPDHSEELVVAYAPNIDGRIDVETPVKWPHLGHPFDLNRLTHASDSFKKAFTDNGLTIPASGETRAAVALLTRSIRIVSGGDVAGDYFDCIRGGDGHLYVPRELTGNTVTLVDKVMIDGSPVTACATARNSNYSFGGHTVFRQGFQKLQIQGVEFRQMGQGGRMAHYPVHFHMARMVPPNTYIKDSSVNESMTRWYVLHSTQGVTLQRNVGWKSIGHGYFLEDGTETDNKFYANIGIYARGGVAGPDNPRNIPGILAENGARAAFPYRSDVVHPTVFWITNGWNEFVGNMAAGANVCGVCFWLVPASNHDMIETDPHNGVLKLLNHMNWSGYAGRQQLGHPGETPIKLFTRNYCTTAEYSLNNTNGVAGCTGTRFVSEPEDERIAPVMSIAPEPADPVSMDMYYPTVAGARKPTVCDPTLPNGADGACSGPYDDVTKQNNPADPNIAKTCSNENPDTCATTVIDHYTSSFNWAETNFSSIWLRTPGWYLLDNSFISDVQNGGVTLISGGDYSRSSSPLGYWALASHSVFVGETQPTNPFAKANGPSESAQSDKLLCDNSRGDACISKEYGLAYPKSNWGTGQRLFNIYDGPAYQDANAYLDIMKSACISRETCLYYGTPGVRRNPLTTGSGFLPNAAIGWKQPNGFYYPPAFHSKDLFFDSVEIRHYVIQPLYKPGTYLTDTTRVTNEFIGGVEGATNVMGSFTDVDRQTELSDDDGTLTGFQNTISVNEDNFFAAPIQAPQCKSNIDIDPKYACDGKAQKTAPPPTARTSPYDYVTTVIYPGCATNQSPFGFTPYSTDQDVGAKWQGACGSSIQDVHVRYDNNPGTRWKELEYTGGTWSKDCGGPFCFGVPIYRQYLTGTTDADKERALWIKCATPANPDGTIKDECNFPMTRMAGAGLWQRSVLTINNGKFYIDTTRSLETQRHSEALGLKNDQSASYVECDFKGPPKEPKNADNCQPRSVNVFEKDKTYFVFVLFAKATTKQTYQLYVGENFKIDSDFKLVKMTDFSNRFKYTDWEYQWDKDDVKLIPGFDKKLDVLEVTLDFDKIAKNGNIEFDPKKATAETCKPTSFCKSSGGECGCNLSDNDPRVLLDPNVKKVCKSVCKEWAVKDLDCPAGGCIGFRFTMRNDASDQYERPDPVPFANGPAYFQTQFVPTTQAPDSKEGGTCNYTNNTPGTGSCKVPD